MRCLRVGGNQQYAATRNTGPRLTEHPWCSRNRKSPSYTFSHLGATTMSVSEGETEARSVRSDFIQGRSWDWDPGSLPLESAFQLVPCGVTFSEPRRLTVDGQLMGVLRCGPHAVPRNVSHALPFPKPGVLNLGTMSRGANCFLVVGAVLGTPGLHPLDARAALAPPTCPPLQGVTIRDVLRHCPKFLRRQTAHNGEPLP